MKTMLAVIAPWYYAARGAAWADGVSDVYYQVIYAVLFNGWIVLLAANAGEPGLWAIAWVLYVAFAAHMAYERSNLRGLRVRSSPPTVASLCSSLWRARQRAAHTSRMPSVLPRSPLSRNMGHVVCSTLHTALTLHMHLHFVLLALSLESLAPTEVAFAAHTSVPVSSLL